MKKFFAILLLPLVLLSSESFAASVTAVKNQKVLINLEGADVAVNDEFFLINREGKKVAIIRLKQIRNDKAIADILKGKGETGFTLQAKASSVGTSTGAATAKSEVNEAHKTEKSAPTEASEDRGTARDTSYLRALKDSYGIMGEYLMNTMAVLEKNTFNNTTETANLKGTGLGIGGFYEYAANRDITVRFLGVLEQYNASGSISILGCAGQTSKECDAKIMYLNAHALAKYYFNQDRYRFWAGGGGGFLVPLSKSSTALNEEKIATNQVLTIGIGMDYQTSRNNYIPVSLEYNYFPPSDTVKASSILLKFGYAWNQR